MILYFPCKVIRNIYFFYSRPSRKQLADPHLNIMIIDVRNDGHPAPPYRSPLPPPRSSEALVGIVVVDYVQVQVLRQSWNFNCDKITFP